MTHSHRNPAVRRLIAELVGAPVRAKTAPTPPKGPTPPELVQLDMAGGMRSAIAAHASPSEFPGYTLCFIDNQPPALAVTARLVEYLAHRDRSLAELIAAPVALGWVRTLRVTSIESLAGPIVGAVRVDVERQAT